LGELVPLELEAYADTVCVPMARSLFISLPHSPASTVPLETVVPSITQYIVAVWFAFMPSSTVAPSMEVMVEVVLG